MLGLIATQDAAADAPALPVWQQLVGAKNSLRVQAEGGNALPGETRGHPDSWGVGWFDAEGQVSLVRQTGSAAHSAYFVFSGESAARGGAGSGPARTVIGHLRKASCGAVTSENAHPVRADFVRSSGAQDTILVAHNGTLKAPLIESLRFDLQTASREEARSDSDTVVLAGWLAAQASQSGTALFDTLANALEELFVRGIAVADGDLTRAYSGVNLLIAHAEGLFALRQFSKNPEYYTLLSRPLGEAEGGPGWIVASEATADEPGWESLSPGVLTFFARDGGIHHRRVAAANLLKEEIAL